MRSQCTVQLACGASLTGLTWEEVGDHHAVVEAGGRHWEGEGVALQGKGVQAGQQGQAAEALQAMQLVV
jgi:hypothetical protein